MEKECRASLTHIFGGKTKTSALSTNAQRGFEIVVLDNVLGLILESLFELFEKSLAHMRDRIVRLPSRLNGDLFYLSGTQIFVRPPCMHLVFGWE